MGMIDAWNLVLGGFLVLLALGFVVRWTVDGYQYLRTKFWIEVGDLWLWSLFLLSKYSI